MIKPLFFGIVRAGKLIFEAPAQLALEIQKYEGRDVQVTIEPKRKKRSLNQNNYYFGVVVAMLGEHFGYTTEEMHEALKFKFLMKFENGKPATVRSSSTLSTAEWEDFMSKVRMWAALEYQVNIPEPNEVEWE